MVYKELFSAIGWKDLLEAFAGLEIRCQEPRAPLNSPTAPSNFFKKLKDVMFSILYRTPP